MSEIEYEFFKNPAAGTHCFSAFEYRVRELAAKPGLAVGDLGGGANPLLDLSFIRAHNLDYSVFDVSAEELSKAGPGYRTVVADLSRDPPAQLNLDLAFSKTVCEHIERPETYHRGVFELLRGGGRALHFFPTLYAPPFVLNRLLPEGAATAVLNRLQETRAADGHHGKFPASYRWCRGPTARQLRRFRRVGFNVVSYRAYFGHDYYRRLPVLPRLSSGIARWLAEHPVPLLTSYAIVELEKPRS